MAKGNRGGKRASANSASDLIIKKALNDLDNCTSTSQVQMLSFDLRQSISANDYAKVASKFTEKYNELKSGARSDVTSSTYKRSVKKMKNNVNSWFGRGM